MTTAALDDTATVRDLLFGDVPDEPTDVLAKSLREHGTIRALIPGLPGLTAAVDREVAAATDGLLSLNLADVAAAGWKKYEALRQAARRTRDAPTTQEVVALATHNIESSHHPTVELFIDGKSIATIEIELQIAFTMAGMLAVVQQGPAGRRPIRDSHGHRIARDAADRDHQAAAPVRPAGRGPAATWRAAARARRKAPCLSRRLLSGIPNRPISPGPGTPIPTRRHEFRWWDGSRWTQRVATQGRTRVILLTSRLFRVRERTVPNPPTAKSLRDNALRLARTGPHRASPARPRGRARYRRSSGHAHGYSAIASLVRVSRCASRVDNAFAPKRRCRVK